VIIRAILLKSLLDREVSLCNQYTPVMEVSGIRLSPDMLDNHKYIVLDSL
jgi:hypothetical protein